MISAEKAPIYLSAENSYCYGYDKGFRDHLTVILTIVFFSPVHPYVKSRNKQSNPAYICY